MTKIKIISSGKIDKTGLKKVGKGFLIAISGAVLAFLAGLTNTVDFGEYQVIVGAILSTFVNLGYKFLTEYQS